MSGTSADGIDVALVDIEPGPSGHNTLYSWELVHFLSLPFGEAVREEILAVQEQGPQVLERLTRLHFVLGSLFADAVEKVAREAGNPLEEVDLIASHGQTVCPLSAD